MRLTKTIIKGIISRVIKHAFQKKQEALLKIENRLALDLYNNFYSLYLSDMARLPESFFVSSLPLLFLVDGRLYRLSLKVSRRFVAQHTARWGTPTMSNEDVSNSDAYAKRILSWDKRKKDIAVQINQLETELEQLLISCRTTGQMEERWPEGKRWIPVEEKTKNLPVPTAGAVNDLLSILAKEEA